MAANGGNTPIFTSGCAKRAFGSSDDHVAEGHQFRSGADCLPVDHDDKRLGDFGDRGEDAGEGVQGLEHTFRA